MTTTQEKCRLCGQEGHADCGFCSDCHDHTVFVHTCLRCEEACYPGEVCGVTKGPHVPDPESEALSVCCGRAGDSYDG